MPKLAFLLLFLLVAAPLHAAEAPHKLALLVGITHYGARYTPQVPGTEQWSELDGSINDVEALAQELRRRGFDVRTLTNEQATHAGILQAFREQLVARTQAGRGDVALFHFSGHGMQIPDDNGVPDEADGYDEAIIPFDNKGVRDYSADIRDDEIGMAIAELRQKTQNIVVFLDSCHAGSATRGARKKRGHAPVHPPAQVRGTSSDGAGGLLQAGDADRTGYVFLSAVRADQEANEDEDPTSHASMGAFTLLLVQALQEAGPQTTYQQVMDRIGVQILGRAPNQNPQIEGDAQKRLFSGEWTAAPKYFRTRPLDGGGRLPIEAGSLHGLRPGAELDVFSAQSPDGPPLARVRLQSVELGLALGVSETQLDPKKFAAGAQAVEVLSQHATPGLRVQLGTQAGLLEKSLSRLNFVQIAAPTQPWDLRVVQAGDALHLEAADGRTVPVPRGNGRPMDAQVLVADADVAQRLTQALEAHYRQARLAELQNTDAASLLDVELTVTQVEAVLDTLPDGRKQPRIIKTLKTLGKAGNDGVRAGDILQAHIANNSYKPCFFTVLELSSDGGISVLYPFPSQAGGENRLEAGQKRSIGTPFRMTPPGGTQVWKVVATEDDIDLRPLAFQVRGAARGAGSALQRIVGEALTGRRSEPFGYAPQKLWGTDAARFEIRE